MRIIISPAKKMNISTDSFGVDKLPEFMEDTKKIMECMQALSLLEGKKLWGCNDKLAQLNFNRYREMDLNKNLTPAILSYEGIQYQYMAPEVFTDSALNYIREHLRIISGFYGVLGPFDGVTPYRLEMQAKAKVDGTKDLYGFWGDKLYQKVVDEGKIIINLASQEYSKCIKKHLNTQDRFITCVFGEIKNGKVIQKGTFAKIARGEMVRFMAEGNIEDPEELKKFRNCGYCFKKELSSEEEYVFLLEK